MRMGYCIAGLFVGEFMDIDIAKESLRVLQEALSCGVFTLQNGDVYVLDKDEILRIAMKYANVKGIELPLLDETRATLPLPEGLRL